MKIFQIVSKRIWLGFLAVATGLLAVMWVEEQRSPQIGGLTLNGWRNQMYQTARTPKPGGQAISMELQHKLFNAGPEALPFLIQMYEAEPDPIHRVIMEGFNRWRKPPPQALSWLFSEAQMADSVLRELHSISEANLVRLGPRAAAAVPSLLKVLERPPVPPRPGMAGPRFGFFVQNDRRWRALDILRAIGPVAKAAVPILVERINNPSGLHPDVYFNALEAIAPTDPRVYSATSQFLLTNSPTMPFQPGVFSFGAIRALSKAGRSAEPVLPDLLKAFKRSVTPMDRAQMLQMLGDVAPERPEVVTLWLGSLEDEPLPASTAANRLIQAGRYRSVAVKALGDLLVKADDSLAWNTADFLATLGNEALPALPGISKVLQHPSERVRAKASITLGQLGALSRETLTDLRAARTNDTHQMVRDAASEAVAKIERASAQQAKPVN